MRGPHIIDTIEFEDSILVASGDAVDKGRKRIRFVVKFLGTQMEARLVLTKDGEHQWDGTDLAEAVRLYNEL